MDGVYFQRNSLNKNHMLRLSLLAGSAFLLFLLLDLMWFKLAGGFFKSEVGSIVRLTAEGEWNVRTGAALLAYVFMALGVVAFVLPQGTNLFTTVLYGGLFGLVSFGIFDLTNLAILSAWTTRFVVVDMAWGMTANALVASALWYISHIVPSRG